MVSFNRIPNNLRTQFFAVEIDNSRAKSGAGTLPYRALLVGQKIAAGSATPDTVHRVTGADEVAVLAGAGSQLHRKAQAWFDANKSTETWIGVLADNAAGVAPTGTLTVTGPATAAGTVSLYIGGRLVEVAVASGDSASTIAASINAAINATTGLAVTSTVLAAVVTLTHRHKGLVGNELDVRLNYQDTDALPTGVAVAVVAMSGGTTAPTLTALIAAIGDSWFHLIAHPYTDATSLQALETELADRFGPMRRIDGFAITAKHGTYSATAALGAGRNSPHSAIFRTNDSPTPPEEYAAHVAAVVALAAEIDPARPFQTLELPWVKAPREIYRDTITERNALLFDGISTTSVGAGDVVRIDQLISTYQTNGAGAADDSYLSATTMLTLMLARFTLSNWFSSRYSRHKLGNDSQRYPAGEAVLTPRIAKAECVAWFLSHATSSPVIFDPGALEQFKTDLVVERNPSNVNRLDISVSPDLMNQLVVGAAKLQFVL